MLHAATLICGLAYETWTHDYLFSFISLQVIDLYLFPTKQEISDLNGKFSLTDIDPTIISLRKFCKYMPYKFSMKKMIWILFLAKKFEIQWYIFQYRVIFDPSALLREV